MKRLLALLLGFVAAIPAARAQPHTEPRLVGGPERICTESEIRQALDGSYTGPACRFTQMPSGVNVTPPPAAQPAMPARPAVQPAHAQPVRASVTLPSTAEPAVRMSMLSQQAQSGSHASSHQVSLQQVSWRRSEAPAAPAPDTETVRLSDDFFSGGLVGGVERPFVPLYSYRGLILIAADGQVQIGHAGLEHRVLQVRAMDQRAIPAVQAAPRRSYPYP